MFLSFLFETLRVFFRARKTRFGGEEKGAHTQRGTRALTRRLRADLVARPSPFDRYLKICVRFRF